MKHFIIVFLSALLLIAPMSSQAKTVPLNDHIKATFVVAPGKARTMDTIREAIAAAGISHGWVAVSEQPGEMTLRNDVRGLHTVVVKVSYDTAGMQVDYVTSENLNYNLRSGVAYIHPKYNMWVDLLIQGVTSRLSF